MDVKLSICIPTYNFNAEILVSTLMEEIKGLKDAVELWVIDDASPEINGLSNVFLQEHDQNTWFQYEVLENNIGRSKIRNLLAQKAQGKHLLFLDGDSLIHQPSFITNYLEEIKKSPQIIICGGRVYPDQCPSSTQALSWRYGVKVESLSVEKRNKNGYKSFMTNNFVIPKEVFNRVRFDETLVGYGHEDTLFGFQLHQNGVALNHIDNAILNGHIENNEAFLLKTEEGVKNLKRIVSKHPEYIPLFKLSSFWMQQKGWKRVLIQLGASVWFKKGVRMLLLRLANVNLLQWYKLQCYIKA